MIILIQYIFSSDIYFISLLIFFIGGRYWTFRHPEQTECSVDLGAQFVTATLEDIINHAR